LSPRGDTIGNPQLSQKAQPETVLLQCRERIETPDKKQ